MGVTCEDISQTVFCLCFFLGVRIAAKINVVFCTQNVNTFYFGYINMIKFFSFQLICRKAYFDIIDDA
jgi:hypothetical protein